jgi:hypothetical protein
VTQPARTLSGTLAVFTALVLVVSLVVTAPTGARASDTSNRWDSISESSGCGDPYIRGPFASKKGWLVDSEAVLGPFGTYFGRSIAQIRSKLVFWTVPYSGGRRVRVHQAMLPSLEDVRASLDAHARAGRVYHVTSVGAFSPRTIGGRWQISRHAMGLAIDINPAQNPYRKDDVLITNMPDWFVQSWEDAGFCWGGDWQGAKDPMHFSWMGPKATPDPTDSLQPMPPATAKAGFTASATNATQFGRVIDRYLLAVADGTGNGTSDVIGLRSHNSGAVLDIAYSTFGFGSCSIRRWFVPDKSIAGADRVLMADVDGDAVSDIVALSDSGGQIEAITATRRARFQDPTVSQTGLSPAATSVTAADFDGDHLSDLWETTDTGRLRIWQGPGFTELLQDALLPEGAPSFIAVGDRDGGDTPELFALYPDEEGARVDVLRHVGPWTREATFALSPSADSIRGLAAGDYDGDGRADAQILTTDGRFHTFVGNTSTGIPASRWFLDPDRDCEQPVLLEFAGTFMDDEGNIFEKNIESIAASGVTRGCNPPFNDRFCPGAYVTREQMAAFLVRALDLTEVSHPGFSDVPFSSTFYEDVAKLATAGITRGCNPPANDRFCPRDRVSREQMAAFLVRGLQLSANDHSGFRDVPPTSTFASDIAQLATAGITRGCNPPANDEFCPRDPVSREQMAAFLDRAGLGDP